MTKYAVVIDTYGKEYPFWDSGHTKHTHTIFDTEDNSITYVDTYDGCSLDAEIERAVPLEIMNQYKYIIEAQRVAAREKAEIAAKAAYDEKIVKWCNEFGIIDRSILDDMYKKLGRDDFDTYCTLVNSFLEGRLRSNFKKSLAERIFQWMHDEPTRSKYSRPLSPKQHTFAVSKYQYQRY